MKMGYGEDKRFRMKFGNVPVTAVIGDRTFHFKSKLEYRFAQYLELLTQKGFYHHWDYEVITFQYEKETKGAKVYTPDFRVETKTGFEYFECKGKLTGSDVTKFKRLAEYYPEVDLTLVFMTKDKRQSNRIRTALKYIQGIMYFKPTLDKLSGLIDMT